MKNLLVKICSLLLTLVMIINIMPAQAFELTDDALISTDNGIGVSGAESDFSDSAILMEIVEERTEFSKEYKLTNGYNMVIVYPEAVHYEEDGRWKDIDSTLKATADGHYATTQGAWQAKFPQQLHNGAEITISKGNHEVSFGMAGELRFFEAGALMYGLRGENSLTVSNPQQPRGEVHQFDYTEEKRQAQHPEIVRDKLHSRVSYSDVYSNTDIIYDLNSYQVKESVVINAYDATLYGYRYTLRTGSLVPLLNDDGSIDLMEANGSEPVMTMPAPYMIDNAGEVNANVAVSLESNGSEYILTYALPLEWMGDEARAWPVVLDPVVLAKTDYKNILDRTVSSTGITGYKDGAVMCGYTTHASWGKMRTYIKYAKLPELTSADLVVAARLSLYACGGNSSTATTIEAHTVTESWDTQSISWTDQPEYEDTVADYNNVDSASGRYSWDITEAVQSWYAVANNGIVLKVPKSEEDSGTVNWKQFYSVDWSAAENDRVYLPYLEIVYRNANGLEDYWDYTATSAGRAGTGYVNSYTGNLVWVHNDIGFGGNRMPVSVSHVYNTNDSALNTYGLGYGWKSNYHQTIHQVTTEEDVEINADYYWIDGDGTKHYFVSDDSGKYVDEDGLELMLTVTSSAYKITDKYGNVSNFDSNGRLTGMVNNQSTKSSITISYKSSTVDLISQIKDGAGRVYKFTYSSDLLSKIGYYGSGSKELASVSFGYSGSMLTSITDQDGKSVSFAYNSGKMMTSATDIDGYKVQYSYTSGSPKRVAGIAEFDGTTAGGSLSIEYAHNQTTFTDHNGNKQITQFNDWGNVISVQDGEGRAQFAQYAVNRYDGDDGKGNQLQLSSKLQNSVGSRLNHSDFETGNLFAKVSGSGSQAVTTQAAYNGSKALTVTDDLLLKYTEDLNVSAGRTETFSAYVKTSGTTARLELYDGTKTYVSETLPAGSGWTRLQVTYKNTGSSSVAVTGRIRTEGTGTTYVDCVQWEYAATASRYNLVVNGDFRYTNSPWSSNSGRTTLSPTAAPELSTQVYKMVGTPAAKQRIYQTVTVSGSKDDTFVLAGWAKGDSAPLTDNRQFAIIGTFNYTDGTTSDPFVAQFNPDADSSVNWQYSAQAMVAKKAYSSIKVEIAYDYNVNTVYFDGIQLYKEAFGNSYTYDADGNVKSVVDLQKQTTDYQYTNNDLTKIIQNGTAKMTYTYDACHNVETATTATGVIYQFEYDKWGNNTAVSIVNGSTKITSTAAYSSDGNRLVSTTDALGNTTTYHYNADTNVLEWVQYPKDTEATRTEYTYDSMYRLASATAEVDSGYSLDASYTYTDDLLTKITTNTTAYTFNYGDFAQISSIKISGRTLASYSYTDDQNRYLESLDYGNGDSVQYTYDNNGRVTKQTYEDGTGVSFVYDNSGALATVTDSATGRKTAYYYDFTDRLMKYVESGDGYDHSVAYTYDNLNNMTKIVEIFDDTKYYTQFAYDDDNRVTKVTNDSVSKSYTYDAYGRPSTRTTKKYDGTVQTETFTYNGSSAQIRTHTVSAANFAVTYTYTYDDNGNILTISDGVNTTSYVYDSANQLIRENNQAGGYTHVWEYDGGGNILSRKEYAYTTGTVGTAQDTATYQYSNSNWRDQLTNIGSYTYYDAVGNPLNNDSHTYTWEHGRQLAALGVTSDFAIISHPEDGKCLPTGRACFYVEAVGTDLIYQWQWKSGNTWKNSQATGAQTSAMSVGAAGENGTTYRCVVTDGAGNVLITGSAKVVHVPILITQQPTDWWGTENERAAFSVQATGANGDLTYQWKWKNGTSWVNSKATGAQTSAMSAAAAGENGTTYRCFITDSSGNTVISEEAAIHTDPLGFTRQPEDYSCGPTDRACFSVEAYGTDVTYQWQFQRSDGPTWYTSNAPGAQTNAINFLASENFGMSYRCVITDSEGNVAYSDPAKVLADSITWDFEYNADGMRTSRTNGVVTYEYVYNGSQLTRLYITDELDGSQSVMAFAYDASGKPLSLNYNGTRYIYATNIQGDVIAILNASGTAIVTYTYDAWGNPLSVGGTHATTLGLDNPLRYRGYVYDNETALYYLQSRYYDPTISRFLNADTVYDLDAGLEGYNLYLYCANDPVGRIDVSGTDSEKVEDIDMDDDEIREFGGGGLNISAGSGTGSMIGDITYIGNKGVGSTNCFTSFWQWLWSKLFPEKNNAPTEPPQTQVPQEAWDTLSYVDQKGRAPQGYKGGKIFINDGRDNSEILPSAGMPYKEYDIFPHIKNHKRGTERLVIGSDCTAWYTSNHYKSFIQLR